MQIRKPLLIRKEEANIIKTSSGEFREYISWRENKDLAAGVGVHHKRFPAKGYLISKKIDEIIILKKGSGAVVANVGGKDLRFVLEDDAVVFIPKGVPFFFDPKPFFEIWSATGPAWYPKQQSGLDYKRKEAGRMIL